MKLLALALLFFQDVDPAVLEKKSTEAREILKNESVNFRRAKKDNSSRIISRDILLGAYSQRENKIHLIRLEIAVSKSLRGNSFDIQYVTPGYRVERYAGRGITRLEFKVTKLDGEEDLLVLDSRHLHLEKQKTSPRDLFYFPYSDVFQNEYFTLKGFKQYLSIMQESQDELCATGAKSIAYPEKLLCEAIPGHLFLTLGAIEQMDDGEFFANPTYSVKKFLAHIARNGAEAFSYSISVDGARGLMQFMNSRRIKTYNLVYRKYRAVNLISDYEKGTEDMKNSIKAAICLADMNLVQMPQHARDKFEKDWFLGGIFVSTAHNGGIGRALRLWREFEKNRISFSNFKPKRGVLRKETENFVKKYIETWLILKPSA